MSDKILEAVKALGGDIGNANVKTWLGVNNNHLSLENSGEYVTFTNKEICDNCICTISEFNTAAAEWLKEAYMHNAAIDLGWDTCKIACIKDKYLWWCGSNGRYFGDDDDSASDGHFVNICMMQEFIDYCAANKPQIQVETPEGKEAFDMIETKRKTPSEKMKAAIAEAKEIEDGYRQWNGEGLPPVGCECLLKSGSLDGWYKGCCIGYDGDFAVFIMDDEYPFRCRYAGFEARRIKPIKSPRDKAIDEMTLAAMTSDDDIMKSVIKESSGKVYDWLKQLTPEQRKEFDL